MALDTEADSMYSYFHRVCLVQVTAGGRHFVIDPLAMPACDLAPLWEVAGAERIRTLMHGADYDLRVLDRDYGAAVRGLEDTQVMAQLLGESRTGLAVLLEAALGVRLDKRFQRADWGERPISPEMLRYAAADTAFVGSLAATLRQRLEDLGRWSWAEEEFRRLEQVRHTPVVPDALDFERTKGARALRGAERDRLFTLHRWREERARERDLPPFRILGPRQMVLLAAQPPRDLGEMARVEGLGPRFVRRWGRPVLHCLEHPEPAPPFQRRERGPEMAPAVRARLAVVLKTRDEVAHELAIEPGLLCPKALAEAIAASPECSSESLAAQGLAGWRLQVLAAPLASRLRGHGA